MSQQRFLLLICLLSLLLLASCEFKPKGDYFLNLAPIPPSDVAITIPGQSDTLVATSLQSYNVQVTCVNKTVLFHRLYIDGVEAYIQNCGNNFSIDPVFYIHNDGIYRMTIEVGINTGSGSIADAMGAEGYLFQKDYMLVVLRDQITFYPELKFDRSNGWMKISMDVPSGITNIKKVSFSRSVGSTPAEVFAVVPGTNHYEATDLVYVGEPAIYNAQTYIGDPTGTVFFPFVNAYRTAAADLPIVTAGISPRGFPLLQWEKTHYAANCGSYRVYTMQWNATPEIRLLGTLNNINDTVFETTGVNFPGYHQFHLAAVPAQVPMWFTDKVAWDSYSTEVEVYAGLPSFYFNRFLSPDGSYIYFTETSNEINEYSTETSAITHVITASSGWFYTYSVSPNGKYLLAATGVSNFSYLFYDLATNQSNLVPSSLVIGTGAETGIISIADNGMASIVTGDKIVVFDFLHQTPVTQQVLPSDGDRTMISADGQYIFAQAGYLYLYKLNSGALQQKWASSSQPGTFRYYSFDPANPSKAKILIDQTMYSKDCETWATEGSFNLAVDDICNIDFANRHILGKTPTDLKVFDLNSGDLQFQNPTATNALPTDLRIKKNTVYHTSGKKLIIF
jgi:hypothetical protein